MIGIGRYGDHGMTSHGFGVFLTEAGFGVRIHVFFKQRQEGHFFFLNMREDAFAQFPTKAIEFAPAGLIEPLCGRLAR